MGIKEQPSTKLRVGLTFCNPPGSVQGRNHISAAARGYLGLWKRERAQATCTPILSQIIGGHRVHQVRK